MNFLSFLNEVFRPASRRHSDEQEEARRHSSRTNEIHCSERADAGKREIRTTYRIGSPAAQLPKELRLAGEVPARPRRPNQFRVTCADTASQRPSRRAQ